MRIFDHPNFGEKHSCLVCGKKDDKPVTLIGIVGTQEGKNIMAAQVHVDCLELYYYPDYKIIAQKL